MVWGPLGAVRVQVRVGCDFKFAAKRRPERKKTAVGPFLLLCAKIFYLRHGHTKNELESFASKKRDASGW